MRKDKPRKLRAILHGGEKNFQAEAWTYITPKYHRVYVTIRMANGGPWLTTIEMKIKK